MRLNLLSFLGILLGTTLMAQETVTVTCQLENCSSTDFLSLYESEGYGTKIVAMTKAEPNTEYTFFFKVPKSKTPKLYYIGSAVERVKPILLGTEDKVKLIANCYDTRLGSIQNSSINNDYAAAKAGLTALMAQTNDLNKTYNATPAGDARKPIEAQFAALDKAKIKYLDSVMKKNTLIGKMLAPDVYTSYQGNKKKGDYKSEIDYFGLAYFQNVDLKDTANYNQLPSVITDAFKSYAMVMLMKELKLKPTEQKAYFDKILAEIPKKSLTYKYALAGIVSALVEKQNINIVGYGDELLKMSANDSQETISRLTFFINKAKAEMVGVPAPEIAMLDTTGTKELKLSDLRGKVVMIDFWASWCGPCRRDNPFVVGLYDKYKSKGFDIFSVSLDQDKDRWLKAIKDDNLTWASHVSDLKGWQNAAARNYNVNSIPRTILLDKEGNIIARDLRGEALAQKLKEVLGE